MRQLGQKRTTKNAKGETFVDCGQQVKHQTRIKKEFSQQFFSLYRPKENNIGFIY